MFQGICNYIYRESNQFFYQPIFHVSGGIYHFPLLAPLYNTFQRRQLDFRFIGEALNLFYNWWKFPFNFFLFLFFRGCRFGFYSHLKYSEGASASKRISYIHKVLLKKQFRMLNLNIYVHIYQIPNASTTSSNLFCQRLDEFPKLVSLPFVNFQSFSLLGGLLLALSSDFHFSKFSLGTSSLPAFQIFKLQVG